MAQNNAMDDNYKQTIKDAADLDDKHEKARAQRLDAEAAYETLAVSSSMGMFGMDNQVSDLLQLELAQELLYKFEEETEDDGFPQ